MRISVIISWTLLCLISLSAQSAWAARFSDVPDDHPFRSAIENLADSGIVNGNPDGTFAPAKIVNRAEFLTMLYRAKGLTPTATAVCLRDVIAGSWYLPVVCDAVQRGYVGGYSDGTFKAANSVNRAEAVKMLLTVLDFRIGDYTEEDRGAIAYPDISLSAWYTKFLAAAFRHGILPVNGQSSDAFGPEQPLTRAEAAAYIDSALRVRTYEAASSSSAAASSQSSSVMTRSSKSSGSMSSISTKDVSFPMEDSGVWTAKVPMIYRFTVTSTTIGEFTVSVPGEGKTVQCTLFLLDETGLPLEVYEGSVSNDKCFLRTTMTKGSFQLETRGAGSQNYTLTTRVVKGDGNDGYSEAKTLQKQSTRVGLLDADDHADYYKFTLSAPEFLLVEVSNKAHTRCTVVPLDDVDLFGFESPECGTSFSFPKGSYIVVLDRKPDDGWLIVDYGVVLKPGTK